MGPAELPSPRLHNVRSRLPLDVADLARTISAIARNRPDATVNGLLFGAFSELSAEAVSSGVELDSSWEWSMDSRPTYGELVDAIEALRAACAAAARPGARSPARP